MKVLFISRATLFSARGGDSVQMENTAKALNDLGVEVRIELCNNRSIVYGSYDFIHFFNITRPADMIYHIDKSGLPFVVSPIFIEYAGVFGNGIKSWLFRLLGKDKLSYLRCIARWIMNGERIMSLRYIFLGHRRSLRYILNRCTLLLPNSLSEYNRLKGAYPGAGLFKVIPNGVNSRVFYAEDGTVHKKKGILCVARFEPQKNQLNLIKALEGTDYCLTLVGKAAPNHNSYFRACQAAASEKVKIVPFKDQSDLAELYRRAKVHILASWFETTGLSSLEAAACLCNLVVSVKGDTKEYFENYVEYCDPGDLESIRSAVVRAMKAEPDPALYKKIVRECTWESAGFQTYQAYKELGFMM